VAVAGALLYAAAASFTHPFTPVADAVTALPLGVAVVAVVGRIRVGLRSPSPAGGIDSPATSGWVMWAGIVAVVAGWELYCLANLPRSRHPTLSSLIDMLDSTHPGKAAAFAAWLTLGWFLAWR
jgi:hypothetical protein